jgi:hypothetical protein
MNKSSELTLFDVISQDVHLIGQVFGLLERVRFGDRKHVSSSIEHVHNSFNNLIVRAMYLHFAANQTRIVNHGPNLSSKFSVHFETFILFKSKALDST